MTTEDMRSYIRDIYGDRIRGQFIGHMSEGQIIAIYKSMQARGVTKPKPKKPRHGEEKYEQLSFL